MRDLGLMAVDYAKLKGAEYVDVRISRTLIEDISLKNGQVDSVNFNTSLGMGIRVLIDGYWGFAANPDLTKEKIEKAVLRAIAIAKASAMSGGEKVVWEKYPAVKTSWTSKYEIDPFTVSLEDKIGLLMECEEEMQLVPDVKISQSQMNFRKEHKFFFNSEGSEIEQTVIHSGAGISATSQKNREIHTRSYPSSFRGQFNTIGYELIPTLKLKENAYPIAAEAAALLDAKQCPSRETTIILGKSQLALQLHESCGHPVELDRVLGMEVNYAGGSFLTLDKYKEKFRYGSKCVNINIDATLETGLGSFAYDDEGVPAQKDDIVKDGIFVGYMTSRETSPIINKKSNGCMRATSWNHIPLIRMTNVNLLPGDMTLDEMIGTTEDGLLLTENRSWSIDDQRVNFQFGTEIGWEIKNGKITGIVKNPTYTGITPVFWNNCDAVADSASWNVWGTPNCGKGQPSQVIRVGHGVSYARFRNVKVGVGYDK